MKSVAYTLFTLRVLFQIGELCAETIFCQLNVIYYSIHFLVEERMQTSARVEEEHVVTQQGEQTFRLIEDLQSAGINMSDIKKLQDFGITTIGSCLQMCKRDLISIKGLSDAKVDKIREAARKLDCR